MFRFTIRDVLWMTVVVALGVGWWLTKQNAVRNLEYRASCMEEVLQRDGWEMEWGSSLARIKHRRGEIVLFARDGRPTITAYTNNTDPEFVQKYYEPLPNR